MRIQFIQDIIDKIRGKEVKKKNLIDTYYVEILSDCNLKCSLCGFGNREMFQRKHGKMSLKTFEKILNKIKKESPTATISPFHHCEPMLHPQLPEMVKAIKKRGLTSYLSFNFNYINRLEDLLKAGVDSMTISVSGFCQETYQKAHIGGNIEKVKENLKLLRQTMDKLNVNPIVHVVYHMYKDNIGEDFDNMKSFANELGFFFTPFWSRCISLELSLKYLREKGLSLYKGETLKWFDELPPLNEVYLKTMEERMLHVPEDYLTEKWLNHRLKTCPVNGRIINIHWTGEISLCSWGFDDRAVIGNYLTTDIEELYKARANSPLCKECLTNNYVVYTEYSDTQEIDRLSEEKLGYKLPDDRKMTH
ncbi:radical SAM protein [bacterium]|nr:radical SAM protein [bacterium]